MEEVLGPLFPALKEVMSEGGFGENNPNKRSRPDPDMMPVQERGRARTRAKASDSRTHGAAIRMPASAPLGLSRAPGEMHRVSMWRLPSML